MVDDPLDTSDMETARSRLKRTVGEWRDAGAPTDSLVLLLEGFVACKVAEMLKQHAAYTAQETAAEQCSSLCHPSEPCSITESGKCDAKETLSGMPGFPPETPEQARSMRRDRYPPRFESETGRDERCPHGYVISDTTHQCQKCGPV